MSLRASALPAVLLSVTLVLGASACSEDEPTPEEARAERVEERLKLSFTDEQVDCMMEQFGEAVLISLDGEGKMPQSGAELEEFTSVAQACVIGSGDTVVESPTDETEGSTAPTTEGTTSTPDSTAPETTSPETTAPAGDEGTGGGPATRPEPADGGAGDDDDGGQGNGQGNGRGNSGNGGDRGNGPGGGRGSGDGESDDD